MQTCFELRNYGLSILVETCWRLSTRVMKFVDSSTQKKQNQTKSRLNPGGCQVEFKPERAAKALDLSFISERTEQFLNGKWSQEEQSVLVFSTATHKEEDRIAKLEMCV